VCQAVRAPGSKVTFAPAVRAGALAWNNISTRTPPVNQSDGPFVDCRELFLLISIGSGWTCQFDNIHVWARAVVEMKVLADVASKSQIQKTRRGNRFVLFDFKNS